MAVPNNLAQATFLFGGRKIGDWTYTDIENTLLSAGVPIGVDEYLSWEDMGISMLYLNYNIGASADTDLFEIERQISDALIKAGFLK